MNSALLDVRAFSELSQDEHSNLVRQLSESLGDGWELVGAADGQGLPSLRPGPQGPEFAVVPGGKFRMGLSDEDIASVAAQVEWDEDWEYSLRIDGEAATPCVDVSLRPFLLQRSLGEAEGMTRQAALEFAQREGFRLPSEAELEWVIRNGGEEALHLGARPTGSPGGFSFKASRFGLDDLFRAHWAADDWFASHVGASADGSARSGGDPSGVCRITFPLPAFCCAEDITSLFAALRYQGSAAMPAAARLARDLPLA